MAVEIAFLFEPVGATLCIVCPRNAYDGRQVAEARGSSYVQTVLHFVVVLGEVGWCFVRGLLNVVVVLLDILRLRNEHGDEEVILPAGSFAAPPVSAEHYLLLAMAGKSGIEAADLAVPAELEHVQRSRSIVVLSSRFARVLSGCVL